MIEIPEIPSGVAPYLPKRPAATSHGFGALVTPGMGIKVAATRVAILISTSTSLVVSSSEDESLETCVCCGGRSTSAKVPPSFVPGAFGSLAEAVLGKPGAIAIVL